MSDPGRLLALLDRLGDELVQLRRLAAMTDDDLVADPERMPGVKCRLQVAIETVDDLDAFRRRLAALVQSR